MANTTTISGSMGMNTSYWLNPDYNSLASQKTQEESVYIEYNAAHATHMSDKR